ncbi:GNAT family N-acetyltransferase [Rhodobacter calidifons]|uniref:GNAT family N-acetyltransferase n=1 Tax=Rhodobacter calidifons TaxID=2715277 RepID=A0ABX0G9F7_9RHOB|nr:GNAT family N-acetyltransferase [Rhodobacter calidifons]NHB77518.1 GNAT family N-acetyltransferase [Rhodobacter calidifons]
MSGPYTLCKATLADAPALRALHRVAFAGLAGAHYTADQIEGFFTEVETVDPDLVADGTYWLIELGGLPVASGGWTMRPPGYAPAAQAPGTATILAVFTDPGHARRGLARRIMDRIEADAVVLGQADRIDLCATLSGLPLYLALGYRPVEARSLKLASGAYFPAIAMTKTVWPPFEADSPVIPAFRASAA